MGKNYKPAKPGDKDYPDEKSLKSSKKLKRKKNKMRLKVGMNEKEIEFLLETTKSINTYFEYGCGGSTVFVYDNSSAKVRTIDTDRKWLDKVEKIIQDEKRFKFEHIDLGPTHSYGYPTDEARKNLWPTYSQAINNAEDIPEVVLIDGRFRIACALATIKYSKDMGVDPIVLIHDAKRYLSELTLEKKYFSIVKSVDSLCMLKISDDIDLLELNNDYDKYRYITR
jgi:protein O-GlcNAc transferase